MDQTAVNLAHILLSLKEVEGAEKNATEALFHIRSTNPSAWINRLAEESNEGQVGINPQQPASQNSSAETVTEDAHQNKKMKVAILDNTVKAAKPKVQQPSNPQLTTATSRTLKTAKISIPKPIIISTNSPDSSSQNSDNVTEKEKSLSTKFPTVTGRGNYRCSRCGLPKSNHVCNAMNGYVVMYNAETQTSRKDNQVHYAQQLQTIVTCSTSIPTHTGTTGNIPIMTKPKTLVHTLSVFEVLEKIHGRDRVLTVGARRNAPPPPPPVIPTVMKTSPRSVTSPNNVVVATQQSSSSTSVRGKTMEPPTISVSMNTQRGVPTASSL